MDAVVPSADVQRQLERILASPQFRNSERLCRFLRLTVETTLAGAADQLKEYVLGRDAFDRGADYDPRTDSIVRVEAQRLRRKLREYYAETGVADAVRIAFHAGSYVPVFSLMIAPEAVPATGALDPRTVAVLPFANFSQEPEQGDFCDGITEDIINALTTIPELKVLGRASMFALRDTAPDLPDIGRQLGAGTLVEGSVRRAAGVLRISAKLIDATTRIALWSGAFDRQLGDVFAIKDEIAGAIAGTLRVTLGFDPRPPVRDGAPSLDAYMMYLKGRQAANQLDQPGYKTAIDVLSRAVSVFPDYAMAYAALADVYAGSALLSVTRPFEAMPRARRAAMEALRLDPRLPQAFASLGWTTFFFDRQWDQGIALARRAISLAPSYSFGHFVEGACLAILGRFDEALASFERAEEHDPLSLRILRGLSWTLSASGRHAEAERKIAKAIALEGASAEPHYMMALVYLHQRRISDALEALRRGRLGSPTPLAAGLEGAILAAAGDRAGSTAILDRLRKSPDWIDPIIYSRIYLEFGDLNRAIDFLRQSIEERSPLALYVAVDPLYARLRADRRVRTMLDELKLPLALTARQ